ncbi:MAG: hypothetical protein M1837_002476 [Sclerophora amabilis]|nr:MAG: hypothetical protein M1837_002476 [Sclerophora amabilis]
MAGTVDYNALRSQTLGSGADEEAVTVNTRALIDKVLSRYSGEWIVLRELIQNASDASAKKVVIRFETSPSTTVALPSSPDPSALLKHTLLHHTLHRLIVSNDGQAFGDGDWSRLKRIAEGNPDETKIGAFGVGFYSVFSECEEPFVSSGNEAMAFYWKGNSLFTRRLRLAESQASPDTTFLLDYRNKTSPVPSLMSLCQFLATSLTFVALEEMELWLDGWRILNITKKVTSSVVTPLPKDIEGRTREGLMNITGVAREGVQIDANWLSVVGWKADQHNASTHTSSLHAGIENGSNSSTTPSLRGFFSRLTSGTSKTSAAAAKAIREEDAAQQAILENLGGESSANINLHVTTAKVSTSVNNSFAKELERATKKPPLKSTKLALLTVSSAGDVVSKSSATSAQSMAIFTSVLPKENGKVFIGFPTSQTTGVLAHISADAVIPTVERESIDMNARFVRTWNVEMLRVVGALCRIAYGRQAAELQDKLIRKGHRSGRISEEALTVVLQDSIHLARQFTFRETTPSHQIGQIIEEAFWMSKNNASIEILSTHGMLSSHLVRYSTEDLSSFMEGTPFLHDDFVEGARDFVQKIKDYGLVTEVTIGDMAKELGAKALNERQLSKFLKWICQKSSSGDLDRASIRTLLDVTVVTLGSQNTTRPDGILALGEISCYINPSYIPPNMPIPPNTVPHAFTEHLKITELSALGWEELQLIPWLRFLVERSGARGGLPPDKDITSAAPFSAQIFRILSRQWDSIDQQTKDRVVNLLEDKTVIPTKLGMRKPSEAYFPSVKLFPDLPVVSGLPNVKDKVLLALKVRKTVELEIIFSRLVATSDGNSEGKWNHIDLIKYLASVQSDIPAADIKRLRETKICPAEDGKDHARPTSTRYKVSQLFEPKEALRNLHLPVLQWPGVYRPDGMEGKFLATLGLRVYPTVTELIEIMARAPATDNMPLRDRAMSYYIANHVINGYVSFSDISKITTPYLPLEGQDAKKLSSPRSCFTNEWTAILGYSILRKDLHAHAPKFGVDANPPIADCIEKLLRNPPKSRQEAVVLFCYFASRSSDIGQRGFERLGSSPIVPVPVNATSNNGIIDEKRANGIRYVQPRVCFLGKNDTFEEMFDFIDFGAEANSFLLKCGSKQEPSDIEIARLVSREPARILDVLQSSEKYLDLLRRLAGNISTLKKDKILFKELKRAPFLLVFKESPVSQPQAGEKSGKIADDYDDLDDEDELGVQEEYLLVSANQAVVVDDFINFRIFKDVLLRCPYLDVLEDFYLQLGALPLSSIVEESPRIGSLVPDQRVALKLQRLVLERSTLFLHEKQPSEIKHNEKWLQQNLKVQAVRSISLRRSLRGHRSERIDSRSAWITHDQRKGWYLWIAAGAHDLFEVSHALVKLLLNRPKSDSAITLEMLLGADLLKLRARGYNVGRILKANAREAKAAEEQRRQRLEEDRRKIEQNGMVSVPPKTPQSTGHDQPEETLSIPGTFADSPESRKSIDQSFDTGASQSRRSKPFSWSSITKHLGLDDSGPSSSLQKFLGDGRNNTHDTAAPPPYSEEAPKQRRKPGDPPEAVTPIPNLQQELHTAVNASRAHDSSSLYSRPDSHNKEMQTYCDESPSFDMSFFGTASGGVKVFFSNDLLVDKSTFFTANSNGLNIFAHLISECGDVFAPQLRKGTLHIFYDEQGGTIAFNRQGSIFCNFRYFQQLHLDGLQSGKAEKQIDALVYWWVVLCHELAHNLVQVHSAQHSYWT